MKLLFDEGLSPKLVDILNDLFPGSERALPNGLVIADAGIRIPARLIFSFTRWLNFPQFYFQAFLLAFRLLWWPFPALPVRVS
jgi:hypothetical protein